MQKIVLEVPDEVLISLKETPIELSRDIRMLAAVKFYQMGKCPQAELLSLQVSQG